MRVAFGESARSTVGIEWEMAIVAKDTMRQAPGARVVLPRVDDPEEGPIRGEYLETMIELVSRPHEKVRDAEAEMRSLLERTLGMLEPEGLTVLPMGAHPFDDPEAQPLRDKTSYARVAQRNAWWGRQMTINGVHVHVGVESREKALPIVRGLARLSCYFIALTASSPLWRGEETGFASQRTMLFQQLATNGPPYEMSDWDAYERYAAELEEVGIVESPGEIRWDVRPSRWGTVENRLMDSVPTAWELGAMAAFAQCTVERYSRALDVGEPIWALPHWLLRENKWRAARYGLAAEVMTPRPEHRIIGMRDGIAAWLEELYPIAEELECDEELARIAELAEHGPSYVRQARVWEATGDSAEVARSVADEALAGRPDFGRKES